MRRSASSAVPFTGALLLLAAAASAQPERPAVPPPPWARSAEVIDDGAIVRAAPREGAARRGTLAIGTRVPLVRRILAAGCSTGVWIEMGREAYVCDEMVRPSREAPSGIAQPPMRAGSLLPSIYAFVSFDGTRAYAHPSDHDADQYAEAFGEGFGLVLNERMSHGGMQFFRTRRGLWVERSNLRFARGSDFRGVTVSEEDVSGEASIGWVLRDNVPIVARPHGRAVRRAGRREIVRFAGEPARGHLALSDGTFVRATDVARLVRAPRPAAVAEDERWIDLDVHQQVLTAYEGDRPVFATLVSSGRSLPTHETPRGEFRIWVKLATSDMDDLEREDVERNYSIESVPWVQFFEGSNGLHTAFWHDDFGRRRSHGCVNLSPADARFVFDFTRPALPPGWTAILPTAAEPGTLIRVR